MSLKRVKLGFALVLIALSSAFVSCTQDEKKPEEAVQPQQPDEPGKNEGSSTPVSAETVYFSFDDYTLNSEGQHKLDGLASKMKENKAAVVQIEGHCDERGSIEYNLALGERRAASVKNYLQQVGIEAARLTTISYGEEKPATDGHTEAAWSKNRRAEFVISQR